MCSHRVGSIRWCLVRLLQCCLNKACFSCTNQTFSCLPVQVMGAPLAGSEMRAYVLTGGGLRLQVCGISHRNFVDCRWQFIDHLPKGRPRGELPATSALKMDITHWFTWTNVPCEFHSIHNSKSLLTQHHSMYIALAH